MAISKAIEKSQNIPLINIETILNSLFQEEYKKYKSKLAEAKKPNNSKVQKEKTTGYRIKYDRAKWKLEETQRRMKYLLDKIEPVKNRFGKDYLKIAITWE